MSNMVLNNYTFEENPSAINDIIRKKKVVTYVPTYSSVAIFDWGATYSGLKLDMEWNFMSETQFAQLESIWLDSSDTVVFNPNDGKGKTFNVYVLNLTGNYHLYMEDLTEDSDVTWRKDVRLSLIIKDEVT
jgi:hypothetical protein